MTPVHNLAYWWKARAHNLEGWGTFSEVWRFLAYQEIPLPPVLLEPDSGTVGVSTSPTLVWNASMGAESYGLQLSATPDFSNLIVEEDSISVTSLDIEGLLNNTTCYWRVNASNDLGPSDWSEVWSFTTLATGIRTVEHIPTTFSLGQNYPNPFNPRTTIRYELPSASYVHLEVFNSVLVNGAKDAGYHEVIFERSNLASGSYLYRMTAGDFVETRKLILLR
jgi:hypothetical protein